MDARAGPGFQRTAGFQLTDRDSRQHSNVINNYDYEQ